jgi:hypothetical protein
MIQRIAPADGRYLPEGGHGVTTPIGFVLRIRLVFNSGGSEVGEAIS